MFVAKNLLLIPSSSILFDNAAGNGGNAASGTWTHVVAGNLLLAFASCAAGDTISSMKCGTTSMTQLTTISLNNSSSNGQLALYYLWNPPGGSQTMTQTNSGSARWQGGSVSYLSASAIGATASSFGSGTSLSQTVTGSPLIVCCLAAPSSSNSTTTPTGGGTQRVLNSHNGSGGLYIAETNVSGTTISDTSSVTTVWAGLSVVLS